MTGPNPDAELDAALGVDNLPPAAVTADHRARGAALLDDVTMGGYSVQGANERAAQVIADAEQRAVARYIAERTAAGATP